MTRENYTNEFHISCMEEDDNQIVVGTLQIPDYIKKHLELNYANSITLYPIFEQKNSNVNLIRFECIFSKSNIPLPLSQ